MSLEREHSTSFISVCRLFSYRERLTRDIIARDIMIKGVLTITADRKVAYARLIMLRHNVGALPVVDEENVLLGIITKRDIDLAGADVSDLLVSDLMTRPLSRRRSRRRCVG